MNLLQAIREKFLDSYNMASGIIRSMRGDPQAWEASIRRFEARESLQPAPADVNTEKPVTKHSDYGWQDENIPPKMVQKAWMTIIWEWEIGVIF